MKRFLIISGILITIIVIVLGVLLAIFPPTLGNTVTLSDYESKEKLMKAVNAHLPVDLPEGAKVTDFLYESWIEWDLSVTVALTPEETQKYAQKVAGMTSNEEVDMLESISQAANEVKYTLKKSNAQCTLKIDTTTGIIGIECGDHE
jgi:hypothetical protein